MNDLENAREFQNEIAALMVKYEIDSLAGLWFGNKRIGVVRIYETGDLSAEDLTGLIIGMLENTIIKATGKKPHAGYKDINLKRCKPI